VAQPVTGDQERLGEMVERAGVTVAVAESLTGGELSARLAATPGSGEWFRGALVAYSSDVKHEVLGVPRGPVVSEPAAAAMASGVSRLLAADLTVAVTGVAGPDEQDGQPPGTVWLAWHHAGAIGTQLRRFPGGPEDVVDATCSRAIEVLIEHLENQHRDR
jgi:nicotinamide-nucleotide amidase